MWFFIGCASTAVAVLLFNHFSADDQGPGHFQARYPPAEFLYLDSPRIANYLAELEGGRAGTLHLTNKLTQSVNGKAGAGGFEIGATAQQENSAESALTPTRASNFFRLLKDLRDDHQPGVSIHQLQLTRPGSLKHLREGSLVRVTTDALVSPGYIRPYVVVRQSATLAALFPGSATDAAASRRARQQRLRAKAFAQQVGPNPRITFAVEPALSETEQSATRLLLPMKYNELTTERSLLEKGRRQFTGGRLVIIGKVVRVFPQATKFPCQLARTHCTKKLLSQPEYTDFATQETWKHPLQGASDYLISHVSHNCLATDSQGRTLKGRDCFLAKLSQQTQLNAPGAVILPIAIYK